MKGSRMSNETRFAALVEINDVGLIVNVWSYEDKYKARDAAQDKAKESPGTLFVVLEPDEAFRAEPVVRNVYLSYPVRPVKAVESATAEPRFEEI